MLPPVLPSRRDLHSLQLCCAAPRSRTTSVVTGSNARRRATAGANSFSSAPIGSVSWSQSGAPPLPGLPIPRASRPAQTRGTKSAMNIATVTRNAFLPNAETNRAFVLMQYFGYLRRNPNDPNDTDYTGYDFWLTKLACACTRPEERVDVSRRVLAAGTTSIKHI